MIKDKNFKTLENTNTLLSIWELYSYFLSVDFQVAIIVLLLHPNFHKSAKLIILFIHFFMDDLIFEN